MNADEIAELRRLIRRNAELEDALQKIYWSDYRGPLPEAQAIAGRVLGYLEGPRLVPPFGTMHEKEER